METANRIAVIGYAASLPNCPDADSIANLVQYGKVGFQPHSEITIAAHLPENFYKHSAFRAVGGGPENYRNFDASFFGYSPLEATYLDPQIRKALEYAWLSCEHAGYAPDQISSSVGIYATSSVNTYFQENLSNLFQQCSSSHEKSQILFLNECDFLATRIAYHLNFTGPALTIKCGCSSSMVAIHDACKGLLNFDCDMALAGGAVIKPRNQYGYHYEPNGIVSKDGRCCPFSNEASGTVFSNGVGFIVLKRFEDALKDKDTIHAIILSSVINNDGSDKMGYMSPSVTGQVKAMEEAIAYSALSKSDISYVETHGTATSIGDPIEFKTLCRVFDRLPKASIALGAVKANVGHLDAISGLAGLLKVIQDLKKKVVSPIANFQQANEKIDLAHSPFYINKEAKPWLGGEKGRLAVVSSYGVGGTNANLIISEYNQAPLNFKSIRSCFIAISAKSASALRMQINILRQYLLKSNLKDLSSIAYTLFAGRAQFNLRWGVIVSSVEMLCEKLESFSEKDIQQVDSQSTLSISEKIFFTPINWYQKWFQGAKIMIEDDCLSEVRRIPLPGYYFSQTEYWINEVNKDDIKLTQNFDKSSYTNEKNTNIAKWFYLPYWQRKQTVSLLPEMKNQLVIFFDNQDEFSKLLKASLLELDARIISLVKSEKFEASSSDRYCVNPANTQHYDLLIHKLKALNLTVDWVISLWCSNDLSDNFERTQQYGLYSLVHLYQAAVKAEIIGCFKTIVITKGNANISGNEHIDPNLSTLLGFSQVFPKEHENTFCQLIDIEPNFLPSEIIKNILYEMASSKNTEVAIRGTRRFVKNYTQTLLDKKYLLPCKISRDKNILITGGLGNFGLELAEFISNTYQAKVFLMTRIAFPEASMWNDWLQQHDKQDYISQKIILINEINANGGSVQVIQADVTNKESILAAKQKIIFNYGKIDGVVHAAGLVDSGMILNKSIASLSQVFAPKVYGTKIISEIFLNENLDFLILCSSMNAIIGGLGQIDNTAANAFVDAYAEYCQQQGFSNVLAINWGAVNEARSRNYATAPQFAELSKEHVKNKMTKEEIFEVYRRLFSSNLSPRVVVSTLDFNQVIANWTRVGSLNNLAKKISISHQKRETFANTPFIAPENEFEKFVAKTWQALLGINKISSTDNFFELGGNSLIAIQFFNVTKENYSIRMHAMSIYEHPTLKDIALNIAQLYKEAAAKKILY